MRYLLDTHVLLWLAGDATKVPENVRESLGAAEERVVSSASAMEIALKTQLGKLPQGESVLDSWSILMRSFMATELSLTVSHMIRAGSLDWDHRDPFDRMLVAQAQLEGLHLVTSDRRILAHDVPTAPWE